MIFNFIFRISKSAGHSGKKLVHWLILGGCCLLAPLTTVSGQPFFIDAIVPAPQAVEYGRWYVFGETPGNPATIRIQLASRPDPLETAAANAIRSAVEKLNLPRLSVEIVHGDTRPPRQTSADLEVLIGSADHHKALKSGYEALGLQPIKRAEAYRIRTVVTADGKPRFLLLGSDPRGAFYAAQSFLQMLTVRENRLAIRALQIDDWPAFQSRASGNDEKPPAPEVAAAAVDWFARFKINAWPLGQSYHWPQDWRNTPPESHQALRRAAALPVSPAVDLRYQIHPFGRSDDPEARFTIRISNPAERRLFIAAIRDAIRAGASEILIRADDFHELSSADKNVFSSKADAHARLINETYAEIRKTTPNIRFYFCPPYYTGKESHASPEAREYLRELGQKIPKDIPILWTGPQVISNAFSAEEQNAFSSLVGRPAYLWDNTVFQEESAFGYRYEFAWYLLHRMDTKHPSNLAELSPGIRFNFGYDDSWINRIGNVVLADYLWNPSGFDPELALRRAVALCVGPRSVDAFLDAASQIQNIFDLKHSPARRALRSVPDENSFEQLIRRLKATAHNQDAVDELHQRWRNLTTTIEQLTHLDRHFASLHPHTLATFRPGNSDDWRSEAQGEWSSKTDGEIAMFTFPFETPSTAGSYAARHTNFRVPDSPSGRYFIHFVFDDNYRATGGPPISYPGYFYKQILIDGQVVWEEDAEGIEPILPTTVEVSHLLHPKKQVELTVRCVDKQGVTNLGITVSVSPIFLTSR